MSIIEVGNLSKSYGKTQAVKGISFAVDQGEIFGLLGPNGAGKTTTLEILEGLKKPDSGNIKILDWEVPGEIAKLREEIGVVLQATNFFPELTLRELFVLFGSFYSRQTGDSSAHVERFELANILHKKFSELSGGQKQRFVLAVALIAEPKVLFLDEPTTGLDPQVRQRFWDIILQFKAQGLTVLLTTHYMEEAEILCDRVAIIDNGKIIATDRPVKLINSIGVASHIRFMSSKPVNLGELEALPGVIVARRDRYIYDLETETPEMSLRELLEWERQYSGRVFNLQVQQATLEDVFLKLTGHSLRE